MFKIIFPFFIIYMPINGNRLFNSYSDHYFLYYCKKSSKIIIAENDKLCREIFRELRTIF